jgi:hypothetical protein
MTEEKIESILIDPPSGWMYGFPKFLPHPFPEDIKGWLVENGYPKEEIDSWGKHFPVRYIGTGEQLMSIPDES